MPEIPKEVRVRVKIRYNGYLHHCLGVRDSIDGEPSIHLFADQFPKAYRAEHDANELVFVVEESWLSPDQSEEAGWVCSEPLDIDAFARSL